MCHPLRSMSITDTSDFYFPRSTNKPVLLSCHPYAACRNAIDRLLKRPSLISLAVTATSYMEGSQPFIYRYAPRGTRTGSSTLKSEPTYLSPWPLVCRCPTLVCKCRILYLPHPTSVKNRLHFHTFYSNSLHNPKKCLTFAATVPATPLPWMRTTAGLRFFIEYM